MQITVSDKAKEQMDIMLQDTEKPASFRIELMGIGWGGPNFAIAQDGRHENDLAIDSNGYTFLMNPRYAGFAERLKVDARGSYLRVSMPYF